MPVLLTDHFESAWRNKNKDWKQKAEYLMAFWNRAALTQTQVYVDSG